MLINEIEEAEKEAEEMLLKAREKASARIASAKVSTFSGLEEGARAQALEMQKKAEAEAKAEAQRILSTKPKFSLAADARKKLSGDIVSRVLKTASTNGVL